MATFNVTIRTPPLPAVEPFAEALLSWLNGTELTEKDAFLFATSCSLLASDPDTALYLADAGAIRILRETWELFALGQPAQGAWVEGDRAVAKALTRPECLERGVPDQ